MKKPFTSPRSAFTLIELLVVMGIIILMGALVVPAVSGTLKGTALNQAAQLLQSQFNAAQQIALAKGQTIELRLLVCGDPESPTVDKTKVDDKKTFYIRGIQLYTVQSNPDPTDKYPQRYVPATKLEFWPNSVILDRNTYLSNICDVSNKNIFVDKATEEDSQHPKLRRIGLNYQYFRIQFRADGSTNLPPSQTWFLTLHDLNKGDELPAPPSNFFTISVDPVQGSNRAFRPL